MSRAVQVDPWWVKYIGIPYLDKGRDPSGLDCWGLVRWVYAEERNLILPSLHHHDGLDSIRQMLAQHIDDYEKLDKPEPWAIALFRSMITAMHVGIMIDDTRMLHAVNGKDTCIEPVATYQFRLKGFYKPRCHD